MVISPDAMANSRCLADKLRDAGNRKEAVVERYHLAFPEKVVPALSGDGRAGVQIVDLRTELGERS